MNVCTYLNARVFKEGVRDGESRDDWSIGHGLSVIEKFVSNMVGLDKQIKLTSLKGNKVTSLQSTDSAILLCADRHMTEDTSRVFTKMGTVINDELKKNKIKTINFGKPVEVFKFVRTLSTKSKDQTDEEKRQVECISGLFGKSKEILNIPLKKIDKAMGTLEKIKEKTYKDYLKSQRYLDLLNEYGTHFEKYDSTTPKDTKAGPLAQDLFLKEVQKDILKIYVDNCLTEDNVMKDLVDSTSNEIVQKETDKLEGKKEEGKKEESGWYDGFVKFFETFWKKIKESWDKGNMYIYIFIAGWVFMILGAILGIMSRYKNISAVEANKKLGSMDVLMKSLSGIFDNSGFIIFGIILVIIGGYMIYNEEHDTAAPKVEGKPAEPTKRVNF